MKNIKFYTVSIVILSILILTSCNVFYSGHFEGGELLDKELMESIKSELFTSEVIGSEINGGEINTINSDNNTFKEQTEVSTIEKTEFEIESSNNTENCENSENAETSDAVEYTEIDTSTVYWTKKGSVWHRFRNCSYLSKSKEIESGSVEDAIEAGKEKLCSSCAKK